jgi:hypothetical protein
MLRLKPRQQNLLIQKVPDVAADRPAILARGCVDGSRSFDIVVELCAGCSPGGLKVTGFLVAAYTLVAFFGVIILLDWLAPEGSAIAQSHGVVHTGPAEAGHYVRIGTFRTIRTNV